MTDEATRRTDNEKLANKHPDIEMHNAVQRFYEVDQPAVRSAAKKAQNS